MEGLFCKSCHNIIYSRTNNDFKWCDCKKIGIGGGFDFIRTIGDETNYIDITINESTLLKQILEYDSCYGNRKVSDEYLDGYYGKFRLTKNSNFYFFERLINENDKWIKILELVKQK